MSVKHVNDYYFKVLSQYQELNATLEAMEKYISDSNLEIAQQNIESIKQQVAQLKENYLRISYIIFLLNMPNKKEKQFRYVKREKKKLENIPEQDRLLGVLREDNKILNNLKSYTEN